MPVSVAQRDNRATHYIYNLIHAFNILSLRYKLHQEITFNDHRLFPLTSEPMCGVSVLLRWALVNDQGLVLPQEMINSRYHRGNNCDR